MSLACGCERVCVCVCVCICEDACVYMCVLYFGESVCAFECVCALVRLSLSLSLSFSLCVCVCVCVCVRVCVCVCVQGEREPDYLIFPTLMEMDTLPASNFGTPNTGPSLTHTEQHTTITQHHAH